MRKLSTHFHIFLATLWLLFLISPGYPLRDGTDQVVTLGTFNAADNVCLMKKIFKGQPSPVTISFDHDNIISYAKAFTEESLKKKSGKISMAVVEGAIGSNSVSLQIAEGANKSVFKSNILLEIRCAAVVIPVPVPT
ncbi:uncharacterized protein LOC109420172 [Aedes albopictus]|uniref:Secreted protein n=1 Tax=Aedes albopictus TaxID=7160 RepID=A0ABM1YME0_AEDAL